MFACATNSWTARDCEDGLFQTPAAAIDQTRFWVKAVQDVVHIAHDVTTISIEGVQGAIITAFLLVKLEGISRRCRFLFATTFWMARDLGLHRIDHPDNAEAITSVQAEIGRRVFWYLCASDWQIAAKFGGANEGTYTFHLRQIITKRPRHVDDEDMFSEQLLSTPTTMSYPLHRIRISEICRSVVDRNPLTSAHLGEPSHEDVMDIDTELQVLLNEVQPFFSMPQEELVARYELLPNKAADIEQQGHTLRFLLHAQRCKLHLPYFTRGYTSSAFSASKDMSIKSARLLIQSQSHLLDVGVLNGTMFPFAGLLLGVFMASIVLLVDLCMNKTRGQENLHRHEVCQAFRLLESARHESETIACFVDSLTQILRKHKIRPPNDPLQQQTQLARNLMSSDDQLNGRGQAARMVSDTESALMTPDSSAFASVGNEFGVGSEGDGFTSEDLSSYFNNLAQNFEQGLGVNDYDWDNIFSDLNASFA
jgi:hypothetical protein